MTDDQIDVSFSQDGGVLKKITTNAPDDAAGPPPKGSVVTAHYTVGTVMYIALPCPVPAASIHV